MERFPSINTRLKLTGKLRFFAPIVLLLARLAVCLGCPEISELLGHVAAISVPNKTREAKPLNWFDFVASVRGFDGIRISRKMRDSLFLLRKSVCLLLEKQIVQRVYACEP